MIRIKSGIDLIHINRIQKAVERLGRPFLERIWTAEELAWCMPDGVFSARSASALAARFAAKEAVAKALGTGIGPEQIRWTDICIYAQDNGQPCVRLSHGAKARYDSINGTAISISLSHEGGIALAQCVLLHHENYE